MRNPALAAAVLSVLLTCSTAGAAARFQILAPAEESFIGMKQVLIIGKVIGDSAAGKVDVSGNGRNLGSAPVQNGSFTFLAKLDEGRHEITLAAAGVQTRTIKIFVGKQKGYRYHIETDLKDCVNCHPGAGRHEFRVGPMQAQLCDQCHDPVGTGKFVHGPVAAGSCTPCHDPHGSSYDNFLVAVGKELCLICHSQNLSRKHIEERRNADCLKCHNPHSSEKEYHLR